MFQDAKARGTRWPGGELYLNVEWLNLMEGRVADWQRGYPSPITRDSAGARMLMVAPNYWVRNRPPEGLRMLDAGLAAHPQQRRNLDAAVLYAQFNRPGQARSVLAAFDAADTGEVKHSFGLATSRRTAMGWILVAERRPLDAVVEFRSGQMASAGPAGPSPIAADAEVGLAFNDAGRPDSAIVAYEHYEATGRRKEARDAYYRLVDLWSNADPELQFRVRQAQQRIAVLAH